MLGFLRERRAKAILKLLMPTIIAELQTLSPVDRAACFAIAHGLWLSSAEAFGESVITKPDSVDSFTAATIVCSLADSHSKILNEVLAPLKNRGMGDLQYAQAMRQIRAMEALIAIIGRRFASDKADSATATKVWRLLWNARGHAEDAADILLRFRAVTKTDAVPRRRSDKIALNREKLVALMRTLPPMFVKAASSSTSRAEASKKGSVISRSKIRDNGGAHI